MNTIAPNDIKNPTNIAWLILVIATGVGWWFGHAGHNSPDYAQLASAGVSITAFIKVWVVGFQFMELRHAPRWLRHAFDAWLILVCGILVTICLR